MRFHPRLTLAALAVVAQLGGCSDDPNEELEYGPRLFTAPVDMGGTLAFIDHERDRAYLVNADDPDAPTRVTSLPVDPVRSVRRASVDGEHREALVLSAGKLGGANVASSQGALTVLAEDGEKRVYETGSNPFDVIQQSEDGRFVFLLRAQAGDRLVKNVNELAVIDLELEPSAANAVVFKTLDEPPRKVAFSEDFRIDGKERRIAVVLSTSVITLIDLEHRDRLPTVIDLSYNSSRIVRPDQVLFDSTEGPAGRIYVRGLESNDVFALRLLPREVEPTRNDFSTAIDIVAAGQQPTDLQVYEDEGETRLLVVARGSREVISVDPATSRTTPVKLPFPASRALVYYEGENEGEEQRPHALLWDESSTRLFTVALTDLDENLGRNLTELPQLVDRMELAVPLVEEQRLVVIHRGQGLTLIDPVLGTVIPFAASQRLAGALLDVDRGRVWLAPEEQLRVAHVDVSGGETGELELDAPVRQVVPMFDAGKLAVVHHSSIGYVTFVDLDEPTRDTTRSVRGFLLEGLLD